MQLHLKQKAITYNPKVHPNETSTDVTDANTYPIVKDEKIVRTMLLEEKRMTAAAAQIAMAEAAYAVLSMDPFVSYHQ